VSDSPAPPEPADSVPLPQGSSTRPDGTETRTSQDPPSPSESSLSKAIDALGNALGWKAIVVFSAVLVGVQRLGSSLFYSEFGVTPEEAGLGYDHMLFEAAAITSLAVVIPFVLYLVFTASFIARCGRGLRRRLAQASAQKSSTVTYVAHRSAIVAVFLAAVWLSRNAHGSRGEIGWLIVGGIAIGALLEVGEGITNPFSGVTIDSARPSSVRRLTVAGRFAMVAAFTLVIVIATVIYQAPRDANRARDGVDVSGFPWVGWQARRATVVSSSASPPDSLASVRDDCLMYLGRSSGDLLLYKVRSATVIRVPANEVIVSVPGPLDQKTSPCR
jgi:hypothetical protein